ncbi:MAG: hypothetical protein WBA46_00215 [Thermomicrobiales bacterium]
MAKPDTDITVTVDIDTEALHATIVEAVANANERPARTPSVGRMLHYVSYGTPGGEYAPEHRAATVTAVNDDGTVDLFVMNPSGTFHNRGVTIDDVTKAPGTCHWPEYVPGG